MKHIFFSYRTTLCISLFCMLSMHISVFAFNGVVGMEYPLTIHTQGDIILQKPDKSTLTLEKRTNESLFIIDGYHLKQAGKYLVQSADNTFSSSIILSADNFSPKHSTFSASSLILSPGQEITLSINAYDAYKNPLSGQSFVIASSRAGDKIEKKQTTTNAQGRMEVSFSAFETGMRTLTAINTLTGEEIYQRVTLTIPNSLVAIGGDDTTEFFGEKETEASNMNIEPSNPLLIHGFQIDFPNQIEVHSDSNFLTISALDSEGNILPSYTGSIRIIVEGDENAILPHQGSYTFTLQDQGKKQFDLAVRFTTIGQKNLKVYHTDNGNINENIRGEKRITVVETQQKNEENTTPIHITSPIHNSTIAQKNMLITGNAKRQMEYIVYINEQEKTRVQTDINGDFSHSLTLNDGIYDLYLLEGAGLNRKASDTIRVSIDTTPPELVSYDIDPKGKILPETNIRIAIQSEKNLSQSSLRIDGIQYSLSPSLLNQEVYQIDITAPSKEGIYPITVEISDALANKKIIPQAFSLEVHPPLPQLESFRVERENNIAIITWAPISQATFTLFHGNTTNTLKNIHTTKESRVSIKIPPGTHVFALEGVLHTGESLKRSPIRTLVYTEEVFKPAPPNNQDGYRIIGQAGNSMISLSWTAYPQAYQYRLSLGKTASRFTEHIYSKQTNTLIEDLINQQTYHITVTPLNEQGQQLYPPYTPVSFIPTGIMPVSTSSNRSIDTNFAPIRHNHVQSGPQFGYLLLATPLLAFFRRRKPKPSKGTMYKQRRITF